MAYTTIDNPELYFQTKLYTGNGGTQSITLDGSENMQPDWVWIKRRNGAESHALFDSVRGVQKQLPSDSASAEQTVSTSLTAFGSDGFTVGAYSRVNASSDTFASWNWKAGTSFSNDASSTSIGSLDSSGSVNETAGFSIVTYVGNGSSGATIKHGLSTVPTFMMIRVYDAAAGFQVYSKAVGNTKFAGYLNATDAAGTSAGPWNNTTPTSSVFTVGNGGNTNNNGGTHIAYIFSERQGFSKQGVYTGNGNANGAFVYTGFKPAWVMIKSTASGEDWFIWDNKRPGFNKSFNPYLQPNTNNAEYDGSGAFAQLLSNGFKINGTSSYLNSSGGTYIYLAFAESPFTTSTGIPTTAR